MTVKKKIEKNTASIDPLNYINQGSEVRSDVEQKSARKGLCIYIPKDFLSKIDKTLKKRIGISRNAWILEALQEKMERESNELVGEPNGIP